MGRCIGEYPVEIHRDDNSRRCREHMNHQKTTTRELVELSNWLGAPEQDCAILGEGNTSARVSQTSFLVKASGTELRTLTENGLIEVDLAKSLSMLESETMSDDKVRLALTDARISANEGRMPSVETPLHAVCLEMDGVEFVGHTHPTAINAFTCSNEFESGIYHRLFPDEIVVCGVEPLLIPYVDPGLQLARVVQQHLKEFLDRTGNPPKEIYLQNHGFIALGSSASQVKSITAMAVKAARIRLGTQMFGGPHPMSTKHVSRINTRPDEHYRQSVIERNKTQ